ncbi:hypothetical protein [Salinigranum marinum]|uniref:hypothetical protein n=1 Tax=Salinigranum marinum TaxID=1515595 RepID=UPI002989BD09|nr:hypothetical protein [Salinigranum marinum]
MGLKRRAVLATMGIGGTAGCAKLAAKGAVKAGDDVAARATTAEPTNGGIADGFDALESPEPIEHFATSFDLEVRLGVGEHLPLELFYAEYADSSVREVGFEYAISVGTSGVVDVVLFSRDEFARYERGAEAEYYVEPSNLGLADIETDELTLSPRDYILLIEHSPPDFVESADPVAVGIETTGWLYR